MMGVVAEYLYRIFIEAKQRPLYFVARDTGPAPSGVTLDE
jgi:hypothetical protein